MEVGVRGGGRRRRGLVSVVASGSVWESRMKVDEEARGGVKVFNGGETEKESGSRRRSSIGVDLSAPKRKIWKSEPNFDGNKNSPANRVSKVTRSSNSQSDTEKSPVQGRRKLRSETRKELGRSLSLTGSVDGGGGIGSPVRGRRRLRSDSVSDSVNGVESRKEKPEPEPEPVPVPELEEEEEEEEEEESNGCNGDEIGDFERDPDVEIEEEVELCQEKVISSENVNWVDECDHVEEQEEEEEEEDEVEEEEMEVEDDEYEEIGDEEMMEVEKKSIDIKEIDVPEPKQHNPQEEEEKPKKVVIEEKKILHQLNTKPATMASSTVKTQPPPPSPLIRRSTIHQNHHHHQQQQQPTKPPVPDHCKRFPHTQSKLQSLVDLVMWRDVSRSAFVFGIGSFVIISSSYTQDLNISFISVISYLGLVYLAATFLYKSIICRGVIYTDDESYVVGEGEAVWLLKLVLPYLNEFLLKLRTLFSGDPSTTMKLAVLLFVLARCGSSITIWKMAKFGFFGVFTLPKVCSSYSTQISAYGKFWIRRFRDAWESCTHKKAVAFIIFTLVWNLSSIVARVWAVFMVFVGIRYYQQSVTVGDDWVVEEEDGAGAVDGGTPAGRGSQRITQNGGCGGGPTIVEPNKTKKGC